MLTVYSGAILDYITAQVPPPQPNQPRPRFSLYLSSQLQYGVVVVYYKQCGFLLGKTKEKPLENKNEKSEFRTARLPKREKHLSVTDYANSSAMI